jgi:DNA topoisomerase-1
MGRVRSSGEEAQPFYHGRGEPAPPRATAAGPSKRGRQRASEDGHESARAAGLRYVSDLAPGIHRLRAGRGFRFLSAAGRPVRDRATLDRIRSLVIPPAWTDVWICADPNGHLQATGRDARGRKQYRYHPRWRETRDETKFDRMIEFGHALPRIRSRTEADLKLDGLPRPKVLATVVQLLEKTLIRVGNDEYARANQSFGLTTLRDGHVKVNGTALRFEFRGKSGKAHTVDLQDRRLAGVVRRCRDLPGYELFQYVDDTGQRQVVDSGDVNAYLREITERDFTTKDFRTWAGTVLALEILRECGPCRTKKEAQQKIVSAIDRIAWRLGNTRAVCRKSYVHPLVLEAYASGALARAFGRRASRGSGARATAGLGDAELALLRLLERAAG